MYKLSIIVPVYNMAGGGKLEYCIRSLLNQTISDYEIIAVDDKSTDNSLELLHRFEQENPGKVRVIESAENGRQGAARNKGILAAKGEYLGFMDADDWVLPDTYECVLRKAAETGADVVGFDMCIVHEHTMVPTAQVPCNTQDQTGVLNHDTRTRLLLKPGPFSTKIYKREFFFDPPFVFPEKIAYEDNAVLVDIVMRMKHFEHISEVKCFYYQHMDSTTHSINQKQIDDRMTAMGIMLDSAKRWDVVEEFHKEIEFLYATRFYSTTLFSYMQGDIPHSMRFVRALGQQVKKEFPDFLGNSYFTDALNEEQLKWVKLQQKSTLLFYLYYNFKKCYRKIRYGKW